MSVTEITQQHIKDYANKYYPEQSNDLRKMQLDFLFEAVCETIVEENDSYEMEKLAKEWNDSNKDAETFAQEKFDAVISSDLEEIVPIQHRAKWVEAAVIGLYELSPNHSYQGVPEEFKD